jgi:hypothetical protein
VAWTNSAINMAETFAAQVALIAFLFGLEQFRPARPQGISCIRLNISYVAALRIIYAVPTHCRSTTTAISISSFRSLTCSRGLTVSPGRTSTRLRGWQTETFLIHCIICCYGCGTGRLLPAQISFARD